MEFEIKKFRDGQVYSKLEGTGDLTLTIRGNTYSDLFEAASVKEAWDVNPANKNHVSKLKICCLIGQRSDRRFGEGESFDLKIIARFINQMNYDQVQILHPHSSVALALIDNSVSIEPTEYISQTYHMLDNPILISPDAGAYKNTHKTAQLLNADLVPANKTRIDGAPDTIIQGDVAGRDCLIVDDLADGGRTFIGLAEKIKENGANKVFLYVTHGVFSNGLEVLKPHFEKVFCTDSYQEITDDFVHQYKVL